MADELTALFGGLLGYVAVLAALGGAVVYLLEIEGVSAAAGAGLRADHAAVERPYVINEGLDRPELRRSVAAK